MAAHSSQLGVDCCSGCLSNCRSVCRSVWRPDCRRLSSAFVSASSSDNRFHWLCMQPLLSGRQDVAHCLFAQTRYARGLYRHSRSNNSRRLPVSSVGAFSDNFCFAPSCGLDHHSNRVKRSSRVQWRQPAVLLWDSQQSRARHEIQQIDLGQGLLTIALHCLYLRQAG